MAGVNIDTNDLVEEIAALSKNVSMLRLECKARSRHEDALVAQVAELEAAAAPKPNRAERRKATKGS